jgi:hypothetical protein
MINPAHPLSITLISAATTALLWFIIPSLPRAFTRASNVAATIARSWIRSALVVFLFSLTISVIPTLIYGIPDPLVHDEFAYLLQGDTFAHDRLTNPPHPAARYLETFHVIQHPTYAAKFPPGQGIALALGFLLGMPIAGVWISIALACVAIEWALRAFVSPRLALLGGLLCAMQPLIAWWSQSYWGGGVAMLGGALLFGAVARLPQPRIAHGLLLGTALCILALSRPLEGLILTTLLIPTAAQSVLAPGGIGIRARIQRILLPCTALLIPLTAFLFHYNHCVTGNAFTFPYTHHARQHMTAPLLHFQPLNEPQDSPHKAINDFHRTMELREYQASRWWRKLPDLAQRFVDPAALIIPLIASLWTLRTQRGVKLAWFIILALPAVHMLLTPWLRPQYMAPLIAPLFLVIVTGLRELARRRAFALVLFVIIAQLVAAVVTIKPLAELSHAPLAVERTKLIDRLRREGGQHLVVVNYGPNHQPLFEFVFNRAVIDASPVVFARSINEAEDGALLDYFRERKVWDLYFDEGTYRVSPR